jgi:AcrR family transcriptional regulator
MEAVTPMTPRNHHLSREEVRSSILLTAREIAATDGWSAVTVRKVAQRIGYTAPIIYEHFGSKNEMLNQVLKTGYDMLHAGMLKDVEGLRDPEDRMSALIAAFWNFAHDTPELYHLMYGMEGARATGEEARDYATPMAKFIVEEIMRFNPEHINPDNVRFVLVEAWSFVHGMIALDISGYTKRYIDDPNQLLKMLTADVLDILRRQ